MTNPSKAELRRTLSVKRRALSEHEQRYAADALAKQLASTRLFRLSRRIACYLPSDGEIDPRPVMRHLWRMRKIVFLPVVSRISHDRLWFAPTTSETDLRPNRYGIAEPCVPAAEWVRAETLDLVLLPLLGFDAAGNRLGRGAGFYDRSLAFLHYRAHLRKPRLLGLAHDFQKISDLPTDPWDVPLDAVVTDRAVYYATS